MSNIVIIGDLMIDRWINCEVTNVSQEAPVVIANQIDKAAAYPGGAGNLARNIISMGGDALLISAYGWTQACPHASSPKAGQWLNDIGVPNLTYATGGMSIKTRFVADNHQIFRWDDNYHMTQKEHTDFRRLVNGSREIIEEAEVVIVTDYGKGCVTTDGWIPIVRDVKDIKQGDGYIIVDPYPNWDEEMWLTALIYGPSNNRGNIIVVANDVEASSIDPYQLLENRTREYGIHSFVCKAGARGCDLYTYYRDGELTNFPSRTTIMNSVVGAGDVVDAAIAIALTNGATIEAACEYGMYAAADAVKCPHTVHSTLTWDGYLRMREVANE